MRQTEGKPYCVNKTCTNGESCSPALIESNVGVLFRSLIEPASAQ